MNWHQVISYLNYWKNGQTIYDIQSPYLYQFIDFVFDDARYYYDFQLLKEVRRMMSADKGELPLSDLGAPSKLKQTQASIGKLLESVVTPATHSEQLYRINVFLKAQNTLELGTCLGINSLYLAKSCQQLYTIEGHSPFINYAEQLFGHTGTSNINLQKGLFLEMLPQLRDKRFDLIYIDGHHEYDATLEYIERLYDLLSDEGIFVLADIHWSKGMSKAWTEVAAQERFGLSLDCFYYGILWKNGFTGPKQHIVYLPATWMKPWKLHKAI